MGLTRREARNMNKARKLKAYLEVARSNDQDRLERRHSTKQKRSFDQKSKNEVDDHSKRFKPEKLDVDDDEPYFIQLRSRRITYTVDNGNDQDNAVDNGNDEDNEVTENHDSKSTSNNAPKAVTRKLEPPTSKTAPIFELEVSDLTSIKAELAARKKTNDKVVPQLTVNAVGKAAKLKLETKSTSKVKPLVVRDIQVMLLRTILGTNAPCWPEWCRLTQISHISHVVVVQIKNFSADTYRENHRIMPKINDIFEHMLEIHSPSIYGDCTLNELFWSPVTEFRMERLEPIHKHAVITRQPSKDVFNIQEEADEETDVQIRNEKRNSKILDRLVSANSEKLHKCTKFSLLMSMRQMLKSGYPFPNLPSRMGIPFVPTKDKYLPVTENSPLFGLDCEMCLTERSTLELALIAIVDEDYEVVYHQFVLPDVKIINYMTKFSGITKEMLENVPTRLHHVQDHIRNILPADAILVGQSLEVDLTVLNMSHPYVIDTSEIYNVKGGNSKCKLSFLSEIFLKEIIQTGQHDPIEDSLAALKLAKLKLEKGLQFGDIRWNATRKEAVEFDKEIQLKKQNKDASKKIQETRAERSEFNTNCYFSLFKELEFYKKNVLLVNVDKDEEAISESINLMGESPNLHKLKVKSDRKVIKKLKRSASNYALSIGFITVVDKSDSDNMTNLDTAISDIYNGCELNSMLVVLGDDKYVTNPEKGICFVKIKTEL